MILPDIWKHRIHVPTHQPVFIVVHKPTNITGKPPLCNYIDSPNLILDGFIGGNPQRWDRRCIERPYLHLHPPKNLHGTPTLCHIRKSESDPTFTPYPLVVNCGNGKSFFALEVYSWENHVTKRGLANCCGPFFQLPSRVKKTPRP